MQPQKQEREWLAVSFKPENFIPGVVIGFILGLLLDLSQPGKGRPKKNNASVGQLQQRSLVTSNANGGEELKMVCLWSLMFFILLSCYVVGFYAFE